ncbi:MAG: aminotransferase class III-fold pyridoxal phosphate-dependent enzyme, partial [Candidatus Marithrix sp.]
GGMPVGAFGGKREIMQHIAPLGSVYQAGTLSGNPVAMAAGLAMLEIVSEPNFYTELGAKTKQFVSGMLAVAKDAEIPMTGVSVGGMFGLFFTSEDEITNFDQVSACDSDRFKKFFHAMLDKGIYLAPSAFETGFVSSAHSNADIEATLAAAKSVFGDL